jgi:hypothetical protein
MATNNSSAKPTAPHRTEPLPYALYDSNGTLFELYAGGKAFLRHSITWVGLEPLVRGHRAELPVNEPSPQESLWPTS